MKSVRRIVIALLVFLLVGEAVVRFDQATWFFREDRMMELTNEAHETPLFRSVTEGTFQPQAGELRVMVIGDSYLHGNHMQDEGRFAVRLERQLQAARPDRTVLVLDATIPGGNTCTNAAAFDEYRATFQPDVLVWGYNSDDPYGGCEDTTGAQPAPAPPPRSFVSTLRWLQAATYKVSALLGYVAPTIATELEIRGVVLPGTHTHHQYTRSHAEDFPGWQRSRLILDEVIGRCRRDGIRLVVLNCPNLAMLGNYGPLEDMDRRIGAYFRAQGVAYIRGVELFEDRPDEDWAVSRYDGHPNGRAHEVLAAGVASLIIDSP